MFCGMGDFQTGFREVIPDQLFPDKWKEFTLNIGGTQALQEIKVQERAGGYAYKDQVKLYTRNRFLFWRISCDTLELIEHSLDVNLSGNAVRYRFQDTPVLEGVSVHETDRAVVVLLSTVSSVHRLTFPHPDLISPEDADDVSQHPDLGLKSIFSDATAAAARDPSSFHVLNGMGVGIGGSQLPHVSASLLTVEGDALFALAFPAGGVILARVLAEETSRGQQGIDFSSPKGYRSSISSPGGDVSQEMATCGLLLRELKEETYVPRFLSGITSALTGGRYLSEEPPASLALHCIGLETYLFCLHCDGTLAMWSCGRVALICTLDLTQGNNHGTHVTEGSQTHVLRKANDSRDSRLLLAAYMCFAESSQVCLVRPTLQPSGASFRLTLICSVEAPGGDLVDLALSSSAVWAVWRVADGKTAVTHATLGGELSPWKPALLEPGPDIQSVLTEERDIGEQYLDYIFNSGKFAPSAIARALALFRRHPSTIPELPVSLRQLRERVSVAVEADIRQSCEGGDMSDETYMELAQGSWESFLSGCLQYAAAGSRPLGLLLLGDGCSAALLIKQQQYSLLRPMDLAEHLMLLADATGDAAPCIFGLAGGEVLDVSGGSPTPGVGAGAGGVPGGAAPGEVGLGALGSALALLDKTCPKELRAAIASALEESRSPEEVVSELFSAQPSDATAPLLSPVFLRELGRYLQTIPDLATSMEALLSCLSLDVTEAEAALLPQAMGLWGGEGLHQMPSLPAAIARLFGGAAGQSALALALVQIAGARLSACLALVVLLRLVRDRAVAACSHQDAARVEAFHAQHTGHMVVLAQTYSSLVWLGMTPAARVTAASVEATSEALALLGLGRVGALTAVARVSMLQSDSRPPSLLLLLLRAGGGTGARAILAMRCPSEEALSSWAASFVPLALAVGRALWPAATTPAAPLLLLSLGQRRAAIEYERLLKWCECGVGLRRFVLGIAQLLSGELRKALDALLAAAPRTDQETILEELWGSEALGGDGNGLVTYYYSQLVALLTHLHHWDCVLALAEAGAAKAVSPDDMADMHMVSFTAHLRLGRHADAFLALIAVADRERARLCLRQLVAAMFERLRLNELLEFPHQSLFSDLEAIVMSRARSLGPESQTYYTFLYAFHMRHGNVRKAASTMLEQALLSGADPGGASARARAVAGRRRRIAYADTDATLGASPQALRRRWRCLLACLNTLRLAAPGFRWLVRPVDGAPRAAARDIDLALSDDEDEDEAMNYSADAEESVSSVKRKKKTRKFGNPRRPEEAEMLALAAKPPSVHVLQLSDIERECERVQAQLSLIKLNSSSFATVAGTMSASETVNACASTGLYEAALSIAKQYDLPMEPVFTHLANACVDLTKHSLSSAAETWAWLKENDIWDLGVGDADARELAWRLLESLLSRYEGGDEGGDRAAEAALHAAAAGALVRAGAFLPHWLHVALRRRDPARLVRLLAGSGRLLEAADTARRLLRAALGRRGADKDDFGLPRGSLQPGGPPLCLPVHAIDRLVVELQHADQRFPNAGYAEALAELRELRDLYVEAAVRTSQEQTMRVLRDTHLDAIAAAALSGASSSPAPSPALFALRA